MRLLISNIIRGSYAPLPPQCSASLCDLVGQLLQTNPRRRLNVHDVLRKPVMRERIAKFLSGSGLQHEFAHTVIHGRPPRGALLVQPPPLPAAAPAPPLVGQHALHSQRQLPAPPVGAPERNAEATRAPRAWHPAAEHELAPQRPRRAPRVPDAPLPMQSVRRVCALLPCSTRLIGVSLPSRHCRFLSTCSTARHPSALDSRHTSTPCTVRSRAWFGHVAGC